MHKTNTLKHASYKKCLHQTAKQTASLCISYIFCYIEIDRQKFAQWNKKYTKMEELVCEFELRSEEVPTFQTFLEKLQEKLDSMTTFKKTFQKFQLSVETVLKKVAVLHLHGAVAH